MKYVYFVSYKSVTGTGRIEVSMGREITGIEDIQEIEAVLNDLNEEHMGPSMVTNYILMRKE